MDGEKTERLGRLAALDEARAAVVERSHAYGPPAPFFNKVAKRWSLSLGVPISARQVVLCLLDMKIERACQGQQLGNNDTPVDIAGYGACLFEIDDARSAACAVPATPAEEP